MNGRDPRDEDEYSATVLGSHWFSGPPAPTRREETLREDFPGGPHSHGPTVPADTGPARTLPLPAVLPDRVEGSVLRFGPGVTAYHAPPFPVAGPAVAEARRPGRGRGLRRYALAAVVLAAVLAYLGWYRFGPAMEVRALAVAAEPGAPGCDSAAAVTAVVTTDGRPGTLVYQWVRSDGTSSERLSERVPRGRTEARLRLLWTFTGEGTYPARAELRLLEPRPLTDSVAFTYRCRG
ncbi:hypothetical protein [Streptomyces sp. NPDC012888]|uniref:hypothetical protein n=1 Tax=Streptomyces sp. NPDC012888 TaxID=3364855 RepID=UPI0036C2750D